MPAYPGHLIAQGSSDAAAVRQIEQQLVARGYPRNATGQFDAGLAALVRLFQSQHVDTAGRKLDVDGVVGDKSWGSLFAAAPALPAGLMGKALGVARSQIGVREDPNHPNSGPQVDAYLAAVGLNPGIPWCMAFVHWCVAEAAKPGPCPAPRDGGVIDVLTITRRDHPKRFIAKADVLADPGLIVPGLVFILDHGGGHGHTGFVEGVSGAALRTVEGNTNIVASSEGVGVFALQRRAITDAELVGFIDFSK